MFGIDAVANLRAIDFALNQAGFLQYLEMLRDGRLRERQPQSFDSSRPFLTRTSSPNKIRRHQGRISFNNNQPPSSVDVDAELKNQLGTDIRRSAIVLLYPLNRVLT